MQLKEVANSFKQWFFETSNFQAYIKDPDTSEFWHLEI